MNRPLVESPTAPATVRLLLLLLLPLIALLIYLDGQVYESGLLELGGGDDKADETVGPFPSRLAGLERAGKIRRFGQDNLYEYINGHAEYFIGAGFRRLEVGEYGAGADGQPKIVVNLYHLGNVMNAFGVLANEAGEQVPADVGTLGFRSGKGVDFIRGPFYVQVSLFDPGLDAIEAARGLDGPLAQRAGDSDLAFHFPELGRVTGTQFVREYYRGMDFLNNVLERSFEREGRPLRAFLVTASGAEIQALEAALTRFLAEEGIAAQPAARKGLPFVTVMDPYEGDWFYLPMNGRFLGVYAPLDDALADIIAVFAGSQEPGSGQ